MVITVSKVELKEILNITDEALKKIIQRKEIKERLLIEGYKLIAQYKIGRCMAYDIEVVNADEWARIQRKYGIKKKIEHTVYSNERLHNLTIPRAKIIKKSDINISSTTAGKWDNILVKEGAMTKDKCVYFKIKDGEWEEITRDGYNAFWTECREYRRILAMYRKKLKNKEVTEQAYDIVIKTQYDAVERFKGYMVVKFYTYAEAANTQRVINMIKKTTDN